MWCWFEAHFVTMSTREPNSHDPVFPNSRGDAEAGELTLISVAGRDRQGLTAELAEIMANYGIEVLDFGQAVIHDSLAWGMVIDVPAEAANSAVFKELLFKAHELDLNIRFTPISDADYRTWVAEKGQPRHIITLLGRRVSARDIARVSHVVADNALNIDRIERLSGRIDRRTPAAQRRTAVEFSVRGIVADQGAMHEAFLRISQEAELDVAIQEDDVFRRNRRLVCFDMDSTLIATEVIDELAQIAGVGEQVRALTARAMHGELDFETSFRQRLALLKGLEETALADVAGRLPITEGAHRLIGNLQRLGYKTAILSGGFTYFAERLRELLGVDYVHAHELVIENGKLTGELSGPVIDGAKKAQLLVSIAAREGLELNQVIAVGDGANDLPMLRIAGLGIAFHAKPAVTQQARHAIGTLGLDGILYLLGMRERDIEDR
ncbi:MAG: phosphoserine phosphatase [Gammaproteobacteria bacterium]|jgi:phosphoserine phosphatase